MDFKLIFSIVGILLSFGAFFAYYRSIILGETKPHIYTWLIFSLSLGIAFIIQLQNGGGHGSFVTFFEFIGCFIAFLLGLKYGEKNITKFDTLCLILALIAIALYLSLQLAIISTILIITIDILAIIPTYRKSFSKPNEETISVYLISAWVYIFAILGLSEYGFATFGYPLSIIFADILLVAFILIRRKQLK